MSKGYFVFLTSVWVEATSIRVWRRRGFNISVVWSTLLLRDWIKAVCPFFFPVLLIETKSMDSASWKMENLLHVACIWKHNSNILKPTDKRNLKRQGGKAQKHFKGELHSNLHPPTLSFLFIVRLYRPQFPPSSGLSWVKTLNWVYVSFFSGIISNTSVPPVTYTTTTCYHGRLLRTA